MQLLTDKELSHLIDIVKRHSAVYLARRKLLGKNEVGERILYYQDSLETMSKAGIQWLDSFSRFDLTMLVNLINGSIVEISSELGYNAWHNDFFEELMSIKSKLK